MSKPRSDLQRVEFTISLLMDADPHTQNALSLNLLTHLMGVAQNFGVDLSGGEAWAVVTPRPRGRQTTTQDVTEGP